MTTETVEVLKLSLHRIAVGYLAGYQSGRNILVFDQEYVANTNRPTLTLSGTSEHPASKTIFAKPWIKQQRLHPVLSNLLPEGALREWFAQMLKLHPDNKFPLFAQLAADLPGALVAEPVTSATFQKVCLIIERRSSQYPKWCWMVVRIFH